LIVNISVIVPTLNRLDELKSFIHSLEKQTYQPRELIIVDQSDDDLIRDHIQDYTQSVPLVVKYLSSPEKSLTRAKNMGVSHLAEDIDLVAFFDDDIVLFPDYLEAMKSFFLADKDGKYAVVTGMIQQEDQNNGFRSFLRSLMLCIDSILCKFFVLSSRGNGHFKFNGLPAYCQRAVSVQDVEVISGGVSVFRKEILERFKFDGNMKTYCYLEDVDIGYRISRSNQNAFLPAAKVWHHHSPSSRLKISTTKSQLIQNYFYLFHKNIPKNFLTLSTFIWSIAGLFVVAACELQFRDMKGYATGLKKGMFHQYDSLFSDWRKKMDLYK
ncbi:MAG: glycosyltransferase, partial [Syntrophales bacterium]|nr:glycosyltransferase [Syntrophales bacterium]